jgi:two-component system, cell cycle response regulator
MGNIMNTNTKVLLSVAVMLIILASATIINVALNFREYAIKEVVAKSDMTAQIVQDGLTAHMVNGVMEKRDFFLDKISNLNDVKKLWIVRSEGVIKQYGDGLINEHPRDEIDKEVLKSGEKFQNIDENPEHAILRVTVPYIATSFNEPNCLACHDVKEGEVLGAISMEFDISSIRYSGAITVGKIFLMNLIFLIVALLIVNYFIKPYMGFFNQLKNGIESALMGDFSKRVSSNIQGEGKLVATEFNTLFEKLDNTFHEIKHSLNTFISQSNFKSDDPLEEAKDLIKELSDVYRFKKTIELDVNKEKIYERLDVILKDKFNVSRYSLFEVDRTVKERTLIFTTEDEIICSSSSLNDAKECRSYRTDGDVISTDFKNLCKSCINSEAKYVCINFTINENITLIITLMGDTADEVEELNRISHDIKIYLETAKPAIESKTLMAKLRESSLRDGLTKLYNRRFLEEFIDQTMRQAERTQTSYSVLMIDIDYFKMVNDTHGHDVGDTVIKGLSEVLIECTRKADLPIRYGGEEFVILLHNTDMEGAKIVGEKIRTTFAVKKFNLNSGEVLQKTLSVGISHYPSQGDSIWKAIKYADVALYAAKHGGRDRVVEFTQEMFENEEDF